MQNNIIYSKAEVLLSSWETVDAQEMHARLGLVRLLVSHPNVTLYTLNAPQADMRDVTPLGIASWSNAVEVIKACLELGAGAVAVDARDGHSATPLMCSSCVFCSVQVVLLRLYPYRRCTRRTFGSCRRTGQSYVDFGAGITGADSQLP